MTETQDFETPTVSERQAVERERAAFLAGARFPEEWRSLATQLPSATNGDYGGCLSRAVLARYPLPKRQRPLRVRLSDGRTVWYGMRGWWIVLPNGQERQGIASPPMPGCGDDLRLLARCLDGELEDVPDDE